MAQSQDRQPDPESASAVAEVASAGSLSSSYPQPARGGCLMFGLTVPCFLVGMVLLAADAEAAGGAVVLLAAACGVVGLGWMVASYVLRLRRQRASLRATEEGAALERARSSGNAAVARVVLPGVLVFVGCAIAGSVHHPAWWIVASLVLTGTSAYGVRARSRAEHAWATTRSSTPSWRGVGDADDDGNAPDGARDDGGATTPHTSAPEDR